MGEEIWDGVRQALGLDTGTPDVWQMSLRAIVVYVAALAIVRLGQQRFLGRSTVFDVILAVILGSILSRAINGSAPFFETLAAGLVLVGLHWLFATISFRSHWFGSLVKGHTQTLIQDGEIQWDVMQANHISERDLLAALRFEGKVLDPKEVELARLERSGDISVVPRSRDT